MMIITIPVFTGKNDIIFLENILYVFGRKIKHNPKSSLKYDRYRWYFFSGKNGISFPS